MRVVFALVMALAAVAQAHLLPEAESTAHAKTMAAHAEIHKLIVNNGKLTESHLQAITDLHGPTKAKTQDIIACAQAYGQELQGALSGPTCQSLFGSMAGLGATNQNDATIDGFCSNPCYPGYVEALRRYLTCIGYSATEYEGSYAAITAWFDFLCTRNPATGQYCLTSWYNNLIVARGSSFQYCYFYGFDYGCCLTSMINYFSASLGASYQAGWATYLRACNLQYLPACPRPGVPTLFVNVRWRLLGTLYSWVSTVSNGQLYRYYLAQVIARHFGVRLGYVTITGLSAGSVMANFQIRGNNNTETESFKATVLARALEAPQLTELQAGIGANGTDGSAFSADISAATASETTVTPVYGGGNSAASLAPSVALFLGAALLALNNAREQLFA